jgi:hypothetical protein
MLDLNLADNAWQSLYHFTVGGAVVDNRPANPAGLWALATPQAVVRTYRSMGQRVTRRCLMSPCIWEDL